MTESPESHVAIAVIKRAVLDAHTGRYQVRAQNWLLSREAENWLDLINIDPRWIRKWVESGCQLKNDQSFQFIFKD